MTSTSETEPTTLIEAIRYFSDPDRAFMFVLRLRWPTGEILCPRCGHGDHTFISTRRIWRCKGCKRQFSLKVGTIFEDSPIGWDKWLPAMWLIANSKNSISSYEIGRSLGVTQKTAWFMLHRIRLAMETETFEKMSGTVEVDETYIGGKAENMHKHVRKIKIQGRGMVYKVPVQGIKNRDDGTVKAVVVPNGRGYRDNVERMVEAGSTVYTDQAGTYKLLGENYDHDYVTHGREFVRGEVHTNGIENFWSILKRAIKGTQIHVSSSHLARYVTEREFAYNNRTTDDLGRMHVAMAGAPGRRLTYGGLTAKAAL